MIVGEALFQALKIDPSITGKISEARRIVNFRHVMVHGYAAIEASTVWGVVESNLAVLRDEVESLLIQSSQ